MDFRSEGVKYSCKEEFIEELDCSLILRATIHEDEILKINTDPKLVHSLYSFYIVINGEIRMITGRTISLIPLCPDDVDMMARELDSFAYVFTFPLNKSIISAYNNKGKKAVRVIPITVTENGVIADKSKMVVQQE